jgi:hypothetical protein
MKEPLTRLSPAPGGTPGAPEKNYTATACSASSCCCKAHICA